MTPVMAIALSPLTSQAWHCPESYRYTIIEKKSTIPISSTSPIQYNWKHHG